MEYSHEIIRPNEDIPFKLFVFEGKDGNYIRQKHWHRSIEIFALFEGELTFFINEEEYPLRPGEFMLVNSNEVHSVFSPRANQTIVLQIPLSTFENYYTDERFIYFSRSSRLQDDEVMELIKDMYRTYQSRQCGYAGDKIQGDRGEPGGGAPGEKAEPPVCHHGLHEEKL